MACGHVELYELTQRFLSVFDLTPVSLSLSLLLPTEAVPAPRCDGGIAARAAAGARGACAGPGGRHGPLGAEVPGGEHHAAVRHGRRRHRRRAEVRRYDGLLSITWETRWRRAGLNLTR